MSKKTQKDIVRVCNEIADMLVEKNNSYGDSALDPVRIFSRASTLEQLYVRIDDKLSRLKRGSDYMDEDVINDLIGYLIMLKIGTEREANGKTNI